MSEFDNPLVPLVFPVGGVADAPLVTITLNAEWSIVLLCLAALLQEPEIWVEGTNLDAAYIEQQILEQIITNA